MISKVYLIDDDEVCLLSSAYIIKESLFTEHCVLFKDPREALQALLLDIEKNNLPEIVILDLHIPQMSGWDFLQALVPFQDQLRNKCFIYVLTSSINEAELMRAQNCGMVYNLLQKPFSAEKFNEMVRDIVFMRT